VLDAMILWSIVTPEAWIDLQKKGRLRASCEHVTIDFLNSYLWMIKQMEVRLKSPRPTKNAMPIWAWYQWEGKKRRMPDLRSGGHLDKGVRGVRLECELSDDRALLSDFELWHFVLNYGYLPESEEDDECFERVLKKNQLSDVRATHKKPLPPKFHKILEKSWERIFDLEWISRNPSYFPTNENQAIQATFWELNLNEVIRVTEFVAR
jgi:hypothetical protein